MCTAVSFLSNDHYFGRNLDLEYNYNEAVTITPRNFAIRFHCRKDISIHSALIGVATIADNYPLYYDATNEAGLSMAGLNFPGNAVYGTEHEGKDNIAPYEFIPWVLMQCKNIAEAKQLLKRTHICRIPFSREYPLSPLHWIISDKTESITVEPMEDGLHILDNPIGILTNNPPFEYHMANIVNYMGLSESEPKNRLAPSLPLKPFSRGMGALGLPGDLSSQSRFVRAAFVKLHSTKQSNEALAVSQFFHILGSVEQQEGCIKVENGFEKTIYSSCCNTEKGIYYYKTYENSQITAIRLDHEDLDSYKLIDYPLIRFPQIRYEN